MPPLTETITETKTRNKINVQRLTETDGMFLAMEVNELKDLEEKAKQVKGLANPFQSNSFHFQAKFKPAIVWRNVALYMVLQTGATIGLFQLFTSATWASVAWTLFLWMVSGVGITAGPHRLWSHKSYKAKAPLKAILMAMNCVAFQNDVIEWSRDHRCHHKWTDTDADPHNINRGFFFSHMGWLLIKKHPLVIEKGRTLDMSDLTSEPILAFQRKSAPKGVPPKHFIPFEDITSHWWPSSASSSQRPSPSISGANPSGWRFAPRPFFVIA